VTKQLTAKWSYIANAVFRIAQNHGEKVTFVGFRRGDRPNRPSLDPPLFSAENNCYFTQVGAKQALTTIW